MLMLSEEEMLYLFITSIKSLLMWQRDEATKVFEHFVSLGVKANATTYSLLVDAHLVKRDSKAAISVIQDMVS